MEYQLGKALVAGLLRLDNPRMPARFDFGDEDIVKVFDWSAVCFAAARPRTLLPKAGAIAGE